MPFGQGNHIYNQNGGPPAVFQPNQGPREQLHQKKSGRSWNLFGNTPVHNIHQPYIKVVPRDQYYTNTPINHRIRNIFLFIFVSVPLMAIAELPPIFIFAVTAYCLITINRIAKTELAPPPNPHQQGCLFPPPYIQQQPVYPQQPPVYPQQPPLYPQQPPLYPQQPPFYPQQQPPFYPYNPNS